MFDRLVRLRTTLDAVAKPSPPQLRALDSLGGTPPHSPVSSCATQQDIYNADLNPTKLKTLATKVLGAEDVLGQEHPNVRWSNSTRSCLNTHADNDLRAQLSGAVPCTREWVSPRLPVCLCSLAAERPHRVLLRAVGGAPGPGHAIQRGGAAAHAAARGEGPGEGACCEAGGARWPSPCWPLRLRQPSAACACRALISGAVAEYCGRLLTTATRARYLVSPAAGGCTAWRAGCRRVAGGAGSYGWCARGAGSDHDPGQGDGGVHVDVLLRLAGQPRVSVGAEAVAGNVEGVEQDG